MKVLPINTRREALWPEVRSLAFAEYLLHHEIARGPEASIFSAYYRPDDHTRRLVHVKKLSKAAAADPEIAASFHREMQLVARIQHPSVARLFRCGVWRERPYAVYQAERGVSLSFCVRFQEGSVLPAQAILEIASHTSRALACAHRSGVAHGPLDPGQILLTRRGKILLGGFSPTGLRCRSNDFEPNQKLLEKAAGKAPVADSFWLGILLLRLVSPLAPKAQTPDVPRELLELVQSLASFRAEARPSTEEAAKVLTALQDRWFDPDRAREELTRLVAEAEARSESNTTIARVVPRPSLAARR